MLQAARSAGPARIGGRPAAGVMAVERHLPLAYATARRLMRRLPASVELDDLVQDGARGLLDAADRFDPARGVKFETFAEPRILGAMLDAQRVAGVRDRRWRTRQGGGRRRPGNEREPGVFVDLKDADLPSPLPGPDALAAAAEAAERVRGAVAVLPRRERFVVESYYWGGVPLRKIGAALGVSESRAAQLHQRAIRMLRPILESP